MRRSVVQAILAVLLAASPVQGQACSGNGAILQVLGSGGPRINATRASASYLLWLDGKGRVLIDAGGGAFLRYGQAAGRLEDLALIAISHLPQIAARGNSHYFVYKDNTAAKTISSIKHLQDTERIEEIAKMIGGDKPSKVAFQNAQELLAQ